MLELVYFSLSFGIALLFTRGFQRIISYIIAIIIAIVLVIALPIFNSNTDELSKWFEAKGFKKNKKTFSLLFFGILMMLPMVIAYYFFGIDPLYFMYLNR